MKHKPKMRAVYDPNCPDCDEGWQHVRVETRHGQATAVRRCYCFRLELLEPAQIPKRSRRTPRDSKERAAGSDR